uniref:Uncharacterized protein n=1 Tax=Laticauda laticaudata TaxID=8630 RepID=A0A8C5WU70_LATLA
TYYKDNLDDDDQILTFFLKGAHRAFTIDGIKGDTLINTGTGPTNYQFLSVCESLQEIIEEKVRRAVKRYLKCDVTQPNPLALLVLPPADCLLSSFCFNMACKDIPTYQSAFRNISSFLKPGRHLLFCSTLEEHYYITTLGPTQVLSPLPGEGDGRRGSTRMNIPPSLADGKKLCILLAQKCSP